MARRTVESVHRSHPRVSRRVARASAWEVDVPHDRLEPWFRRNHLEPRVVAHQCEFDSALLEGALQGGERRLFLAECIVNHRETKRRYVLIASVRLELF